LKWATSGERLAVQRDEADKMALCERKLAVSYHFDIKRRVMR